MILQRRGLLHGGFSLGALTMLAGCDVSDDDTVARALHALSRWNDRVQAAIFRPNKLAPEFPETAAVKDFRYNQRGARIAHGAERLSDVGLRTFCSGYARALQAESGSPSSYPTAAPQSDQLAGL